MKVKRLYLVTGDTYENVEIFKNLPGELSENVPGEFIGVKSDTFTAFISAEMIVSIELEESAGLRVISS